MTFITAGYPTIEDTVPILQGFQEGGVDIIELGVPFSDPIADGPTIQVANTTALNNGITVQHTIELVKKARDAGVTVPIILVGYYNPILHYGEEKLIKDAQQAGANGFIVVDLPPEDAVKFRSTCTEQGLSYIPLVAPSTTDERLALLSEIADSFIYVVSKMGTLVPLPASALESLSSSAGSENTPVTRHWPLVSVSAPESTSSAWDLLLTVSLSARKL